MEVLLLNFPECHEEDSVFMHPSDIKLLWPKLNSTSFLALDLRHVHIADKVYQVVINLSLKPNTLGICPRQYLDIKTHVFSSYGKNIVSVIPFEFKEAKPLKEIELSICLIDSNVSSSSPQVVLLDFYESI